MLYVKGKKGIADERERDRNKKIKKRTQYIKEDSATYFLR